MSRALLVGVVLAVVTLAYVFYPLIGSRPRRAATKGAEQTRPRSVTDEEIEAAVRSYREAHAAGRGACPACGARPEPDAVFCSTCGRRLDSAAAAP